MYIKREVSPKIILFFSWRTLIFSTVLSIAVTTSFLSGYKDVAIPFLPIATIGTAVAFYVGFKNNAAYDRLWEARKIWGELVNSSRSLAAYLKAAAANDRKSVRRIVFRQLAYVNMLRIQLRQGSVWGDSHIYTQLIKLCPFTRSQEEDIAHTFASFCDENTQEARLSKNVARALLCDQIADLTELKSRGVIDEYECSDLTKICCEMFNHQGKAERIKSFPFPRQYAYFSEIFVRLFIVLIPFGLVNEFARIGSELVWLTVPFSVLISWIFYTMERVGDTSENPFENGINDVPMTAICRNLEIDLKDMLDEKDLPAPVEAVCNVLM